MHKLLNIFKSEGSRRLDPSLRGSTAAELAGRITSDTTVIVRTPQEKAGIHAAFGEVVNQDTAIPPRTTHVFLGHGLIGSPYIFERQ